MKSTSCRPTILVLAAAALNIAACSRSVPRADTDADARSAIAPAGAATRPRLTEPPPPNVTYVGQPTTTRPATSSTSTSTASTSGAPTTNTTNATNETSELAPIKIPDVLFATLSFTLTAEGVAKVRSWAGALVAALQPDQNALVEGWADSRGAADDNYRLSVDRVSAVIEAMVAAEPSLVGRLKPKPHGEDDLPNPTCPADCPANRVVIISVKNA